MKRLHAEYELLHRRVFDALAAQAGSCWMPLP
jgi:hypothetical protein